MGAKDGHSKTLLTGENDPGATNVTDVSNEKLCVKLTLISFPKLNRSVRIPARSNTISAT